MSININENFSSSKSTIYLPSRITNMINMIETMIFFSIMIFGWQYDYVSIIMLLFARNINYWNNITKKKKKNAFTL